jgi:uncharacterized membrane protein YdjX (TVP38/TMEM64 family)
MSAKKNEKQDGEEQSASKWPLYVSLGLLAVLVLIYFLVPDVKQFVNEGYNILTSGDEQRISNWVEKLGVWGPIFIVVTMVAQMFLIVIPSPLLMVVSVVAYGPVWGAALSVLAIFVASSIGYWIGHYFGEVAIYKLIGEKKENQLEKHVQSYGIWAVIITRLAPVLSNDAISFVGGILRMGYWRFIGATLVGIIPLAALIGYFGENSDRLKTGLIWTSGICLVLFVGYIIYDQRKKKSNKNTSSQD